MYLVGISSAGEPVQCLLVLTVFHLVAEYKLRINAVLHARVACYRIVGYMHIRAYPDY